jgi:hypothetical protein
VNGRTDDGHSVVTIAHRSGELKIGPTIPVCLHLTCNLEIIGPVGWSSKKSNVVFVFHYSCIFSTSK